MPTIRIDDDTYKWLQNQARPFEDTPNSVLRRIAGLDDSDSKPKKTIAKGDTKMNAKTLNELWNVGALHALYHKDGCWYNNLTAFPGAFFDPNGYVLFQTEADYLNSSFLNIGKETNVPSGISAMTGYARMRN